LSLPPRHKSFSNPQFGKYDTLIKYTLVPSIPLSIIAILCINPNTWVLSEIHHFYIELFAVILAAILSFYYIARAYTLNDKFSLFIGIGFLANALIDLLHVVISYTFMDEFLFLKYFIPQTWFAGRIFLSAMFAIAIAGYPALSASSMRSPINRSTLSDRQQAASAGVESSTSLASPPAMRYSLPSSYLQENSNIKEEKQKIPKILLASLVILTVVSAGVAISSLFIVFPGAVLDDFPIHRPYEIPPLALFLIALIYFYKNELYKKSDVFYKGLLGALVIDIFGQIIMSYSTTSFDTAHNVAHVLKDAAYFVNIIGLALSSIQYNAKLREANMNLIERERIIRSQFEKLKESDKMKDEFVNVAAHELRTPIQPILGMTGLLKSKIKDNEQHELLDVTIRNAKRLQRLTDDILDVTKIESQSLKLSKEKFNLNDVIVNCINDTTLNRYFNSKKDVKILYEPKDIFIEADKGRVGQVISNLLSNALKFTIREGASISIVSDISKNSNNSAMAIVSVKDAGQGIDPDILPRLFSKFATKSDAGGTGLGLYISRSIIEAHNGRIWAENNPGGNGATFYFTLPLQLNTVTKTTTTSSIDNGI
jgi:signal transduction histidine kinase